jgi:lipopolysaccharide cholinephosphotransferase
MANNTPRLTKSNLTRARSILFSVTKLLDDKGIVYHLEGGTLLGIVRDNDLLPWDHDVDISIPARHAADFLELKTALFFLGYKVSVRKSKQDVGPVKRGNYSVFKIKPIWSYMLSWVSPEHRHAMVLDIFIKTDDLQHTYWQAMDKVMRVDKKYYQSFETISYLGNTLKVPNHFKDYLTQKYGDWSVPVKDWSCDTDERTVINY